MGEGTPEAIEIQCPGCGSRFRLTPKKGRLPSRDIPCPKCSEDIPVTDDNIVDESASSPEVDESDDAERSSSAPGFGVMSPTRKAKAPTSDDEPSQSSDADDDDDDPTDQLERLAKDLPAGSTMAGLPGVGTSRDGSFNPFEQSRSKDKTDQVDPSVLERVAAEASAAEEDASAAEDDRSATGTPPDTQKPQEGSSNWSADQQPDTSPRLVSKKVMERLANESTTAVTDSDDDIPAKEDPTGLKGASGAETVAESDRPDLRETAERDGIASRLRETTENRSVASELEKEASDSDDTAKRTQLGHPAITGDDDTSDDKPTREVEKSSVLGRIKTKKKRVPTDASDDESTLDKNEDSSRSSSSVDLLEKIKAKKKKATKSQEGDSWPESDSDGDADGGSLSNLFKKVRKKRGADSGKLKARLKSATHSSEPSKPEPSDLPIAEEVEISEGELADIVDRTTGNGDADDDADAERTAPSPRPPSEAEPDTDIGHGDIFAGVESPEPAEAPPSGAVGSVSKKRGKTTTQSMLARLQKRRDGDDDGDAIGTAGEKRGSGYIRLPTNEIQEVLGQGDFRLKIEGVVYEPVDKDGLITLIKSGVLLGAEELAEGNGDWMPVSEHPVFGELRRKMASEAHHVLSRLGLQKKELRDDDAGEPLLPKSAEPEKPSLPESTQAGASTQDADIASGPPTTTELDTADQEKLRVGMTDKHFAVDPDEPGAQPKEPPSQAAKEPPSEPAKEPPSEPAKEPPSQAAKEPPSKEELDVEPPSSIETSETAGEVDAGDDKMAESAVAVSEPTPPSDSSPVAPPESSPEPTFDDEERVDESGDELETFGDQERVDAEEALEYPQGAKKSKAPIIVVLFAGIAAIAAGVILFTDPGQEFLDDLVDESEPQETDDPQPEVDSELAEAVESTIDIVADARDDSRARADAIAEDPSEPGADAWIQERLEEDAYADVVELMSMQWDEGRRDAEFLRNYSRALIESDNYSRARTVALRALSEAHDEEFTALHRRAVTEDDRLTSYDYVALDDASDFSALGVYDQSNHSGLIFENRDKFDGTLIFKPETRTRENNWRVEIAAWRFCELVACHFEIFEVQPALITRDFVDDLTGDTDGFDEILATVNWDGVDDRADDAVRGSLEYVPDADAVPFPLGGPGPWLPQWRRWVSAGGTSPDVLAEPVAENLDALDGELDADHYDALLEVFDGVTTGDAARQISALITFDFLFNNPDRITRINAPDAGINKPIVDSTMVARHNGDAFSHLRISRRVEDRFGWTTRHSRSTVASIRALDRDILADVLFPEATAAEQQLVDAIWQQRNALRDRVDDLIGQRSEDEVLHFP